MVNVHKSEALILFPVSGPKSVSNASQVEQFSMAGRKINNTVKYLGLVIGINHFQIINFLRILL